MKRISSSKPINPSSRDTSSKNKVFIILGIAILALIVLGSLLFFNGSFVGKAIEYNADLLSLPGSAGIPSLSNSTVTVGDNNYLIVAANIGSGDGLTYQFSFTYNPYLFKVNGVVQGVNYFGMDLPLAVVDVKEEVIPSSPDGLRQITVTGALIPSKSLRDYFINLTGQPTTIVPLLLLNITPANVGVASVDFTDFIILNENNVDVVPEEKVFDTTFNIVNPVTTEICNNKIDDNKNGLVDCADVDCNGMVHHVGSNGIKYICELGKELNCKDWFDNDGDDPNLANNIDEMYDCLDPDCDGKEHYIGQICNYGTERDCADDQFDNDFDGLTNCDDSECYDQVCTKEGTSYCENGDIVPSYSTTCTLDANHNNIPDYDEGFFCAKGDGGFSNSQGEYKKSWIIGTYKSTGEMAASGDTKFVDTCSGNNLNYYYCLDNQYFDVKTINCLDTGSLCNSTYGFCQGCTAQCSEPVTGISYQCGDNGCGGTCGTGCPTSAPQCVNHKCVSTTEICDNGVDDNGNSLIDCADTICTTDLYCRNILTSCQKSTWTWKNDSIYVLESDLTISSDNPLLGDSCFKFERVNNLILDCQGHKISGSNNIGRAVTFVSSTKVGLKNCLVSNFNSGVILESGTNMVVLENNLFQNNNYGLNNNLLPNGALITLKSNVFKTSLVADITLPANIDVDLVNNTADLVNCGSPITSSGSGNKFVSVCDGLKSGLGTLYITALETDCSNNKDDDGNGKKDCADPACTNVSLGGYTCLSNGDKKETFCADTADNDGDGVIDCYDYDCSGVGNCKCNLGDGYTQGYNLFDNKWDWRLYDYCDTSGANILPLDVMKYSCKEDGIHYTLDKISCGAGKFCSNGKCVICTPVCTENICGAPDACGGICKTGSCDSGQACTNGVCVTSIATGDVDASGEVNTGDAIKLLKYSVGLITLTEQEKKIADVNCDGSTDGDAILILKYAVGLRPAFVACPG